MRVAAQACFTAGQPLAARLIDRSTTTSGLLPYRTTNCATCGLAGASVQSGLTRGGLIKVASATELKCLLDCMPVRVHCRHVCSPPSLVLHAACASFPSQPLELAPICHACRLKGNGNGCMHAYMQQPYLQHTSLVSMRYNTRIIHTRYCMRDACMRQHNLAIDVAVTVSPPRSPSTSQT